MPVNECFIPVRGGSGRAQCCHNALWGPRHELLFRCPTCHRASVDLSSRIVVVTTEDDVEASVRDAVMRAWPEAVIQALPPSDGPAFLASDWDMILMRHADLEQVVSAAKAHVVDDASPANDEFLSVFFHEIRTPLTPILAWAQLLKRSDDAARVAQAAEVIERNVRSQMAIVDDVLDISKIAQHKLLIDRQHHDLREIVQAAVAQAREAATEKRVHLDSVVSAVMPAMANVDRARAEQIITYLLTNAVRFTAGEGTVTVTLQQDDERATITVQDTGLPIADDLLPFAFEPFRASDRGGRTHGAAGIQLALARGLAELHGGTLEAASSGSGATFTLRLPAGGQDTTAA
jgi:signal transduction histidine kinase